MKHKYLILLSFLLAFLSCENNIRPDTYFDCYLDVEFGDDIEWVELNFEYARMHAEDDGSSYITTLKLNPVDHKFEANREDPPLFLGDSEWRATEINGFDIVVEATVKYLNGVQKFFERCEGELPLNEFEYLLQDNEVKDLLFKVKFPETIEDDCLRSMVEVSFI